jgi:hypothetical protein
LVSVRRRSASAVRNAALRQRLGLDAAPLDIPPLYTKAAPPTNNLARLYANRAGYFGDFAEYAGSARNSVHENAHAGFLDSRRNSMTLKSVGPDVNAPPLDRQAQWEDTNAALYRDSSPQSHLFGSGRRARPFVVALK